MSTTEKNRVDGVTIVLTPRATEEVLKFMDAEQVSPTEGGLRVSVLPGGCSGFKYSLNIEERPLDDDMIVEVERVRLFVDGFSLSYLNGVTIDYVSSMQGSGFTFERTPPAGAAAGTLYRPDLLMVGHRSSRAGDRGARERKLSRPALLLAGMLAATAPGLAAQGRTATVSGRVTDSAGSALRGAQVLLDTGRRFAETDSTGRFQLGGVGLGANRLTVRRIGFTPRTIEFDVAGSRVDLGDIRLAAAPLVLEELTAKAEVPAPSFTLYRRNDLEEGLLKPTRIEIRFLPYGAALVSDGSVSLFFALARFRGKDSSVVVIRHGIEEVAGGIGRRSFGGMGCRESDEPLAIRIDPNLPGRSGSTRSGGVCGVRLSRHQFGRVKPSRSIPMPWNGLFRGGKPHLAVGGSSKVIPGPGGLLLQRPRP
ncbi:MAG: iron-sulfur cluster assembly accessory protein [Gemmatimonadales bacterium]